MRKSGAPPTPGVSANTTKLTAHNENGENTSLSNTAALACFGGGHLNEIAGSFIGLPGSGAHKST